MEKLEANKFCKLTEQEMKKINGGLPSWNVWNQIGECDGTSIEQRSNWFGMHDTTDIRQD